MPIYEYECGKCRKVHEISQKITAHALKKCPECGSTNFKKLISRSSFALKGSGYYTTDYKRAGQKEGKPSTAQSEKAAQPAAEPTPKLAPEKKPEKTPEKKTDKKDGGAACAPAGSGKPAIQA